MRQSLSELVVLKPTQFSHKYLLLSSQQISDFKDLHELLYQCVLALNDFYAGSVPLKELLNGQRTKSIIDFQIFLKVLEVYGSGYPDDIDKVKYNNRQNLNHH